MTGSSATTASRLARCRRSRPTTSSTPGRPARAWPPACGSAGWASPPRWLAAGKRGLGPGPAALAQLPLAEFIPSGAYDRQIRRARLAYRRRRDRLAAALRRQDLRVTGIAAGMHAVLGLPRTSVEHAALSGASERG